MTEKTANNIGEMLMLRKCHGAAIVTAAAGQSPMTTLVSDDYREAGKMMAQLYVEMLNWLYHTGQDREAMDLIEGYLSVARPNLTGRALRNEAIKSFQQMHRGYERRKGQ